FTPAVIEADFKGQVESFLKPKIAEALSIKVKQDRYAAAAAAQAEAETMFLASITDKDLAKQRKKEIASIVEDLKYHEARSMILDKKVRIDGRDVKTVRPIANEVGLLPRAHGSGLFTRGETQCLATVTLGTGDDEQMVDALLGTQKRK